MSSDAISRLLATAQVTSIKELHEFIKKYEPEMNPASRDKDEALRTGLLELLTTPPAPPRSTLPKTGQAISQAISQSAPPTTRIILHQPDEVSKQRLLHKRDLAGIRDGPDDDDISACVSIFAMKTPGPWPQLWDALYDDVDPSASNPQVWSNKLYVLKFIASKFSKILGVTSFAALSRATLPSSVSLHSMQQAMSWPP